MTVTRMPQYSGSLSSTCWPVVSFVTNFCGISTWAWPTRIASIPGTCAASRLLAFSGYGRASP